MSHPQFSAELLQRAEKRGPITIGLAGAGQMGTDIVVQVALMPGMRIGAISEVRPQAAIDAALLAGHHRSGIVLAGSAAAIDSAIEAGKIAVTEDLHALAAAGRIDVIIDATGNPNIGTLFAFVVDFGHLVNAPPVGTVGNKPVPFETNPLIHILLAVVVKPFPSLLVTFKTPI